MSAGRLFLARRGEIADPFYVTDDARQVVDVFAVALGARFQVTLVDVAAVVAHRVRDVEREIVASFRGGYAQQLPVLFLRKVLFEVHVQSRSPGQVFDVFAAVQAELVDDVQRTVLHDIEVTVVAVAGHGVTVFPVPFGMFDAHVLGGDHFAVEKSFLRAVFFIVPFHEAEHLLHESRVLRIVIDLDS